MVRTRSTGYVSNTFDAGYPSVTRDVSQFPYSDSITGYLVIGEVTTTATVSLFFDPLAATAVMHDGTAGAEVVFAGAFGDALFGAAGDDLLAGRGGSDLLQVGRATMSSRVGTCSTRCWAGTVVTASSVATATTGCWVARATTS